MTELGARWGTGRVADLEAGRVSPTLPTLLVLGQALTDVTGREVRLADLLAGDGQADIADTAVPLSVIRSALTGAPVQLSGTDTLTLLKRNFLDGLAQRSPDPVPARRKGQLWLIQRQCGEVEQRTARQLGVDETQLLEAMAILWGQALAVERDGRAGVEASAQTKGRISRQLKTELKTYFEENDGNH